MFNTPLRLSMQFFAEDLEDDFTYTPDDDFELDFSDDDFVEDDFIGGTADEENPIAVDVDTPTTAITEGEEPSYKVKYNGQEKELPLSELIVNAQKGLNYDKVLGERDAIKQSKEFALLDNLAKSNGLSREQFIEQIERQQHQAIIEQQVSQGIPPAAAERLYQLEEAERLRAQKDNEQVTQQSQTQAYVEFANAYPDVKEFPPEVITSIADGKPPLYAYMEYENKQLKLEKQASVQNDKNALKSTGSLLGDQQGTTKDPFLAGFESAF